MGSETAVPNPMLMSLSPALCIPRSISWWVPSCLLMGDDGLCTFHLFLLCWLCTSIQSHQHDVTNEKIGMGHKPALEEALLFPSLLIVTILGPAFAWFCVLPLPACSCFGHCLPWSTNTRTRDVRQLYSLCLSLSRQLSH